MRFAGLCLSLAVFCMLPASTEAQFIIPQPFQPNVFRQQQQVFPGSPFGRSFTMRSGGIGSSRFYDPFGGGFGGLGFGYSTALSARLFGQAELIRAQGDYLLNSARAMEHRQQAIKQEIRNHRSAVENYFALKQLNRQQRELNRRKLTPEQIEAQAKQGVPERLASHELSGETGEIQWPVILLHEQYIEEREAIQKLFQERNDQSFGLGTKVYHDTRRLTRSMRYRLRDQIKEHGSEEYLHAYQFLVRVAYEARFSRE